MFCFLRPNACRHSVVGRLLPDCHDNYSVCHMAEDVGIYRLKVPLVGGGVMYGKDLATPPDLHVGTRCQHMLVAGRNCLSVACCAQQSGQCIVEIILPYLAVHPCQVSDKCHGWPEQNSLHLPSQSEAAAPAFHACLNLQQAVSAHLTYCFRHWCRAFSCFFHFLGNLVVLKVGLRQPSGSAGALRGAGLPSEQAFCHSPQAARSELCKGMPHAAAHVTGHLASAQVTNSLHDAVTQTEDCSCVSLAQRIQPASILNCRQDRSCAACEAFRLMITQRLPRRAATQAPGQVDQLGGGSRSVLAKCLPVSLDAHQKMAKALCAKNSAACTRWSSCRESVGQMTSHQQDTFTPLNFSENC